MNLILARLGALSYIVWSVLHFQAARAVYQMGSAMAHSPEQSRVLQDAWNLFFFAVAALGIAVAMNWRNSRLGFWLNLAVVSVADAGFIVFVMIPGHVAMWPGMLGPIFWILGAVFSAAGVFWRSERVQR